MKQCFTEMNKTVQHSDGARLTYSCLGVNILTDRSVGGWGGGEGRSKDTNESEEK